MAPGKRLGSDNLTHLQRLEADPEKHHIFHALRVLESAYPNKPRIGESRRPQDDMVRFGQEAEMAFPPSTIAAYVPPKNDRPGRFTNRFFGLFGPNGPLPLHMTEFARDRLRRFRDSTFIEFANMITHRLMTLLFRAWRSGQPAPSFDRGDDDKIERKIAAIAGFHGTKLRDADQFPDLAKRHFAGLLSQGPRNAEGLVSILQAFFGAKVHLQPFVGMWLELESGDRWQLGSPAGLGQTTSVGERVWSRSSKFRIRIGPLTLKEYERLLPGGGSLPRFRSIVRNYVGDALDFDVNLILRAEDIPEPVLGQTVRLGQTSWIGQKEIKKDADNLFLEPNAQVNVDRDRERRDTT